MGFLSDGSVHKRDRNLILSPKGLTSSAVLSAQSSLQSAIFVSTINYPIPAGALPGDLAVFTIANTNNSTAFVITPAGWTLFDFIQAVGNGYIATYTRILQPGDTNIALSVGNVGVSYSCNFQSYTGASEIAVNAKILDAASSTTVNFANPAAPLQRMQVILLAIRNLLFTPPWLSFSAQGNIAPIFLQPQGGGSPPAFASAVCTGRMVQGALNIGGVVGTMGNAAQYSTGVLLIR